jgi:DNA-binding response OmpR family regulator
VPNVLVAGLRPSPAPALERAGLAVRAASDGRAALDALAADPPDVVVLAAELPDLDGTEVVRQARAECRTVPICLVTHGRADAGLAAGADDAVRVPVSPTELAARLLALARPDHRGGAPIRLGDLAVAAARATRRARDLHLTGRELRLLRVLARHAGQVLDRSEVLAEVWGYPPNLDSEVPDLVRAGLCRKLTAGGEPPIVSATPGGIVLRP